MKCSEFVLESIRLIDLRQQIPEHLRQSPGNLSPMFLKATFLGEDADVWCLRSVSSSSWNKLRLDGFDYM